MEKLKDIFISYKNDGEGNHFAARLCEDLKFPEQYLISPFTMLADALISVNNKSNPMRSHLSIIKGRKKISIRQHRLLLCRE